MGTIRTGRRRWRAVAAVAAFALGGCLSSTHQVPLDHLYRLSEESAEERARHVPVVQNLGHHTEPPPAPRVHTNATIVVDGPSWVGGQPRPTGHSVSSAGGASAENLAELKAESAAVLLIAAGALGAGLALTRGAQYDGWVELHPMHPVHLIGPSGEYTWVPLSQITPETVDWASRAYVRPEEGPWQRLGRRPLDRRGFTYGVYFGGSEISLVDAEPLAGFMGRINLGYHPTHAVGIGADFSFGWTDDELGNTVFDGRYAAELSAYPFSAGRVHGGLYGQIGGASRSDDGAQVDDGSALFGGGVLLQLDVTTYLALTGRAGVTRVYGNTLSDIGIGINIY